MGGAEHNMCLVLDELRAMGHEAIDLGMRHIGNGMVGVQLPDPAGLEADRFLVGNWAQLDPRWVLGLMKAHPGKVDVWIHDRPWCAHRTGECNGHIQPRHACRIALYWTMMQQARRVYFYAPDQMLSAAGYFGPSPKYTMLPMFCENSADFYAHRNDERDPGSVVYLGRISGGKGAQCLAMFAGTNKGRFTSIKAYGTLQNEGQREELEALGVTICEPVPVEEVPAILGRSEWFFHQPPAPDACPRTVTEARLAGCRLILGPHCGNLNHPDWQASDEELVAITQGAPRHAADLIVAEVDND